MDSQLPQRPYAEFVQYDVDQMLARSRANFIELNRRRSVRKFSDRPVDRQVIQWCVQAAGTAPSGANRQPWHFVVVQDPDVKQRIRHLAEAEEYAFYHGAAPDAWVDAVRPLGTNEHKPFLSSAPYLIVVFAERYQTDMSDGQQKNYYVNESVGIATGLLIQSLHHAGLATLTHTPSPMKFLNEVLQRPASERPYLILVTGYPAADATVPELSRKTLAELATFV